MGALMSEERKVVGDNETPSAITDHPFTPRGEWFTVCEHCGLAEAAHVDTTIDSLAEIRADHARQTKPVVAIEYFGEEHEGYYNDNN